jgi:hypothetical protein
MACSPGGLAGQNQGRPAWARNLNMPHQRQSSEVKVPATLRCAIIRRLARLLKCFMAGIVLSGDFLADLVHLDRAFR